MQSRHSLDRLSDDLEVIREAVAEDLQCPVFEVDLLELDSVTGIEDLQEGVDVDQVHAVGDSDLDEGDHVLGHDRCRPVLGVHPAENLQERHRDHQ